MTTRLYASFTVGDMAFGVDAIEVQEVLRQQPLTQVPLAGPEVRGLMNLRGQIVIALEMRERLGLSPRDEGQAPINIVLRTNDGPLAIIADEVGDVFEADDGDLLPRPETISGPARNLVQTVHQLDDELLLIIDVHETAEPSPI